MSGHAYPRYERYKDSGVEWLGKIPEGWGVCRIKNCTYLKGRVGWKGLTSEEYLEEGYAYLVTGTDFGAKFIAWKECHCVDRTRYEDDPFIQLRNGDLLITKDGTIGKLCLVRNLDKPACLNSGIFLVRPIHSFATEFMYWTLASRVFRVFCDLTSSGATIQHLYQNVFERFTFPAPSIREQRRIAAFLDRETAKIDLLIAKQEALIAKLEERRKALISRAVTRGMDPKARLKDSGVEWLGRIPEHWGVERNRWVFNERDERSEEGNEELLTVSHLTGVTPRADKDVGMFLAESLVGYKRCRSGDLAINTLWAWMGALGVSRCDGILSPAYNVYELAVDGEPRYFEYLFRTRAFIGEIVRWSKGVWSSRLRLYPREFLSIRVPLPPMSEQRAIIVHLDEEMLRMDGIARKAEALVEKLRERRTALISAAVTGKIRVAEADAVEGGARKRSAGVCHG